ncbi:uncharacterized protein ATC70_011074 [Mucor velutinosus]|uniref:BHLH domain-containing protein n=1 Tax=Mucor velutinosus TaxID=708070 RepID=A0AAN7I183_9FUNG|nr:hypothetical protein ATC70_011074 [Mucor velutinosus]
MSEILLSNSAATNHYDYSNGSMMVNINPGLVQKTNSSSNNASTSPVTSFEDNSHHQYTSYPAYAFQPMPMGFPPVPNYHQHPMSRLGYFNDPSTTAAAAVAAAIRQPNSPESISSSSPPTPSPPPPSTINSNTMAFNNGQVLTTQSVDTELINPLVPSSSTSTSSSASTNDNKPAVVAATAMSNNAASATTNSNGRFNNPTTARVKEMITRANSVPMEFYHTEFLEYSKETYEKKMENKRNKRKRPACPQQQQDDMLLPQEEKHQNKKKKTNTMQELQEDFEEELDEEDNEYKSDDLNGNVSNAEIRRQIHIQSEQKRRAQIKDGFDELRKHLPGCNNKKMSKAALLTRTVQQLQHLKGMQNELLSEVERLLQENESLKKFQHGVLQRQAMEKMYTF